MANYLDYAGLGRYDEKIKEWSNSDQQIAYKKVIKSADGNYLYFYLDPEATLLSTPDETIELGSADAQDQLNKLAALVGAQWVAADPTAVPPVTGHWNFNPALSGFDAGVDSVVEALNALAATITSLDATEFALAEVNNNVVTIHGISETDGVIAVGVNSANDIVLEEVAYTGAAEDVSTSAIDDGETVPTTLYAAGTVQGTLTAIARDLNNLTSDSAVTVYSPTSSAYAAVYELYQGDDGTHSPSKKIGTINIPKDMVIESGSVVLITFDALENKLYDGIVDVTEIIKGAGVTPTAADAGEYIRLIIANATDDRIYIKATSLVDSYTSGSNVVTDKILVTVDNDTNQISAYLNPNVKLEGTDVNYANTSSGSTVNETVQAALTRLDGDNTTAGSVSKKIKDAVDALDTATNVNYVTITNTTINDNTVTQSISFKALKETNGIIDKDTTDEIVELERISENDIDSLFI